MWTEDDAQLPPRQRAIRAKCVHPARTFVRFPSGALDASLSQRFEEQVRRHPDRLAVKTRQHVLTYAQLNVIADRIASAILRHSGAGEEPVGLLFDHDALVIGAMLGALKAAKPYVALDPSYPRQRLQYILGQSTARLLLTERKHEGHARGLAGDALQVLDVDSIDAPSARPDTPAGPHSYACIVYTSGSTGLPKGTVQNHRNVLHDVMHYTNSGHYCADDRFLLVSSVSFADSIRTIYGALLNGAALCPFDIHSEGLGPLTEWMLGQGITIYRSVPTVFRHFVQSLAGEHGFRDLRLIYLSGEPVKPSDVELYKRHFPPTCVLVNRLGTTEALTFRCYFIDHDSEIAGSVVPVGYAVPDKDVLLVDERGEAVPDAATGEISVRSSYLSPGYWRSPDLTRAAFAADPEIRDLRRYRTGDLGRIGPDGCLECLGRKDSQVKIRGHRVETAEVEAALLTHDTIREAVVIAEHRSDSDRLVAYLVFGTHPTPDASTVRRFLATRLPEYMIPSAYMVLDAMPLLPNGKLDRHALPEAGTLRPELSVPFVAPRSSLEEQIALTWAEALGLDRVGVHDDFFDLGGDSMAAMRIIARVKNRFSIVLSVPILWTASTVSLMAELVARDLPSKPEGA